MDFITKIYNSEYFVIGLFILIAILAVLFIILVMSGRKKKVEKESNKNMENDLNKNLETINTISNADTNTNTLNSNNINENANVNNISNNSGLENNIVSTPDMLNNTQNINADNSVDNFEKMSFSEDTTPTVSNPTTIDVPLINEEAKPIEQPTDLPTGNEENLFNTSIFHSVPTDMANTPIQSEPVNLASDASSTDNNDITANLFEPVPDLSKVSIDDTPVNTITNNDPSAVNLNNQIPPIANDFKPVEPVMPSNQSIDIPINNNMNQPINSSINIPTTNNSNTPMDNNSQTLKTPEVATHQRVVMPNQFSSVYVNKETPKVEETPKTNTNLNNNLAYDPTLFTSSIKSNVETPQTVSETNSTSFKTQSVQPSVFPIPNNDFDLPKVEEPVKEVPALEPLPDLNNSNFSNDETFNVNPNNTFDFPLPKLTENNNMPNNNTSSSTAQNSTFPNFNTETYDVK